MRVEILRRSFASRCRVISTRASRRSSNRVRSGSRVIRIDRWPCRGDPLRFTPLQDSEDIVLRGGELVGFQQFLEAAHEEIAGADDVEEKFLLNTIERTGFMNFFD